MRAIICFLLFLVFPALAEAAASSTGRSPAPLPFHLLPSSGLAERLLEAEPGSWVEYVATLEGQPVGSYLRYVHAGRTEEGLWLELWLSSKPGSAATAFRILLEADAAGGLHTRRVQQRLLGGKITELELGEETRVAAGGSPRGKLGERWTTVMTRAGSFRAREISLREADGPGMRLFLAEELPLLGIARMDLAGGTGFELHAFGRESRLAFGAAESTTPSP